MQGCKTRAKWSTLYTSIPRAEATGNLDLRIECTATRIEHAADGRVNAVIYRDARGSRAAAEGARRVRGGQRDRNAAASAAFGLLEISVRACQFRGTGGEELLPSDYRIRLGNFRQTGVFLARRDAGGCDRG